MGVETIAVIGAGSLGREIAYAAALAEYRTILEDNWPLARDQAVAWIKQARDGEVGLARMDQKTSGVAFARLTLAASVEAASREADLMIETVERYSV